ncbi:hypothetical protein FISHEDRAFT_65324 [Fistulina hepatica ATCC 64428]|nr:hypothetical protein FISHEDRAFT_65324 [Fistulina hepatica ATCC 64428]
MPMRILLCVLLSLWSALPVLSGFVGQGGNCSKREDHVDPGSHKFLSQCDDQTCASSNGTCASRLCRRDEFPLGYPLDKPPGALPPPLCPAGTFCPDEGSGCRTQVGFGMPCQLERDDQCAPPPDWQRLASAYNNNGSICLGAVCRYANVTLGKPCIFDNTTYIDVGPDGKLYMLAIARDNCRSPQLYCDVSKRTCVPAKALGESCLVDQECEKRNCRANACTEPPGTPRRVPTWQYVVTSFFVLVAMVSISIFLTLAHKRHRVQKYQEIRDYYFEQMR